MVTVYRDICLEVRIRLGYSQRDIAEMVGCSERTIKRFERDGTIGLGSFLKLLKVLNIKISIEYGI